MEGLKKNFQKYAERFYAKMSLRISLLSIPEVITLEK